MCLLTATREEVIAAFVQKWTSLHRSRPFIGSVPLSALIILENLSVGLFKFRGMICFLKVQTQMQGCLKGGLLFRLAEVVTSCSRVSRAITIFAVETLGVRGCDDECLSASVSPEKRSTS